jgi:hypothetical protein
LAISKYTSLESRNSLADNITLSSLFCYCII